MVAAVGGEVEEGGGAQRDVVALQGIVLHEEKEGREPVLRFRERKWKVAGGERERVRMGTKQRRARTHWRRNM